MYKAMGVDKAAIEEKTESLLSQMTLKEKVWLLNGNWKMIENVSKYKDAYNPVPIETNGCERLGIPPVGFSDGPRGVSMGKSTCFPISMARGASFDRDVERKVGEVIAREVRGQNGNYFAGVCINLLRHPAWGRAQETYGEDPYHVGEFGKVLTETVQDHNIMACIKHYAVNNIENTRFRTNVTFDNQRTLHEVYLPHFRKCVVDAGAASLMGAYNKMEGDHACESKKLLTEILREMWGFEGFTSSDFMFGIRDTKKALEAGMDVEMPTPVHYQQKLLALVEAGEVDVNYVDEAARRVIRTVLAFTTQQDKLNYGKHMVATRDNDLVALDVAEKSMVLLKNDGDILPLTKTVKKLLVVGDMAGKECVGDQGSSRVQSQKVVTYLDALKREFGDTVEIVHCSERDLDKAKQHARLADAVLIVAGLDHTDEGEYLVPDQDVDYSLIADGYQNMGHPWLAKLVRFNLKRQKLPVASDEEGKGVGGDRANLGIRRSQVKAIEALAGINPNTVVNLISGSMLDIAGWADKVPCILQNWYPGQEGGTAWVRILFGDVNPSGKLPFSIVRSVNDLCPFDNKGNEVEYGFYHGYTLLDKEAKTALYPFGFGLSYTQFDIANHTTQQLDNCIRVSVDVTNTGDRYGGEVVQVYVGSEGSSVERHKKLLKGFEKVYLAPGETQTVQIDVMLKELEYFDESQQQFVFEFTDYQLYVGNSSDNAALSKLEVSCKQEEPSLIA
ncbi:glycoside hydrolase family 3 protein [Photobacterium sp. OFAV2-7]|uniref:beta-glucosidase n=1 Tax=Photobacterium sp. OFAV2-7 TaxID=2917748 RepID=UPI001EF7384F|nr:glycoside hydrolase family 3 C-terminal domain-containing protein [Photobacterium sp. OFAV2-7]MCG7584351.1 glycoside hydrolase family 3 C-terminal domain-containing protein [Photobacterium sp. OFAV2-7]